MTTTVCSSTCTLPSITFQAAADEHKAPSVVAPAEAEPIGPVVGMWLIIVLMTQCYRR